MALSGGRLTGSLYILKNGHPEALVGLFMAFFSVIPVMTSLAIGRWVDRAGAVKVLRSGIVLVLLGAWLPVVHLSMPTLLVTAMTIGFGFNVMSVAAQHTVGHLAPVATPAERMANFGWFALGHSSSSTIGPFIAGLLIDHHRAAYRYTEKWSTGPRRWILPAAGAFLAGRAGVQIVAGVVDRRCARRRPELRVATR